MPKHKQPTKEELEVKNKEILENLEKPSPSNPPPSPSQPVPSPSEPVPSPSPSPEPTPSPSQPVPGPSEPVPLPSPDYKKKFSASSRENQKILAKNRKINQAIDKAKEMSDPTDEEMQAEYGDWDEMSDFEKTMAKENIVNKRFRESISEGREEGKKIEKWGEDVDKFINDPKTLVNNPELEGKQDEFRIYANEEKNNSVSFDVLIPAFLHTNQEVKKKNKGKMFPDGSGGHGKSKPPSDKISIERAAEIKKNDYKEYVRLLKAGKIEEIK